MANRYWVGASGAAWGVTSSWSATSGGAPGASVPFTSDNAIFDQATTYTVNCSALLQVIDFTVSAGTVTFTGTGGLNLTGNFFLSAGTIFGTSASPLGNLGLFPTAAKTITTSGTVIEALMAFAAGAGGSWQLQDALTLGSARTFQLSTGRVDLNNKAVVCGFFNANYTTTRGVDYGTSGSITVIGAGGAMVNINAASGWSTTGTQVNNVSYSGSTAVTIVGGLPAEATAVSFNITAGTYALTLVSQNRNYRDLNFTGFSGTLVAPFGGNVIYGSLTLSPTMTLQASTGTVVFGSTSGVKTITSNGQTIDFPIQFNGVGGTWQLVDAMTVGSTRTTTLTSGTIDINGKTLTTGLFAASVTTARTIAFGTGNITCVGAGGTLWTTATTTNLSITGTPVVNISNSGATATTVATGILSEASSISFNFTSGTYSLSFLNVASYTARNVNFTGFAGTLVATSTAIIYGNLTISSGMTLTASANAMTFGATSGPKTITTSAKTFDFPLNFNGVGGTWQLLDALTMGTARTLTHTNGTIDLNGKNLTVGTSYTTAAGTKNLTFNSGALFCPIAGATAFNNAAPTGFTTTEGTTLNPDSSPYISMGAATAQTFVGGGSAYNCYITNDANKTLTVSGNNTFKGIINNGIGGTPTFALTGNNSFSVIRQYSSPGSINLLLTAGTTQTFTTSFSLRGLGGSTCSVNTTVAGSKATITKTFSGVGGTLLPVVSGVTEVSDNLIVRDIDFTPNTATTNGSAPFGWYLGENSTNSGNNSGAAFVTYPQVVYYISDAATTSWTTPADWNPSNNGIYLVGAGGGGSAGTFFSTTSKTGGAGGGGGGYTAISNYSIGASSTISSIAIGAAGAAGSSAVATSSTGGTGGSTTIPNPSGGTYSAAGGVGGSSSSSAGARNATAGTGGVGANFTGGTGGTGAVSTTAANGISGSGGGGAAGQNGNGATGGPAATSGTGGVGGGGGGNGGGSNASVSTGGNNSQGFGGGSGGGGAGRDGGGGGGGSIAGPGAAGTTGIDILKTIGGGGGAGAGGGNVSGGAAGASASGVIGGGGAGGALNNAGSRSAAGAGGGGIIVITYTPLTATGNFFFMF